jgi:hypothetical protein
MGRVQRPTTITDLIRATLVAIAALIIGFAPRTNWGATPQNCPHDCPCDAPKQRCQSQRHLSRLIREVKEAEGFTKKIDGGRQEAFRLANRCRSRPERNISVRRIDAPRRFAERALLARLFWRQQRHCLVILLYVFIFRTLLPASYKYDREIPWPVVATRPTMIQEEGRTARPLRALTDERG